MEAAHGAHGVLYLISCLLVMASFGWKEVDPRWGVILFVVVFVSNLLFAIYETHRDLLELRQTAMPSSDEAVLLGQWSVTKLDLIQKWTFFPDRMVISDHGHETVKGTWRLEEGCVRIEWNSLISGTRKHHWATLKRPLNPAGTRGDAWDGQDIIHAIRIARDK